MLNLDHERELLRTLGKLVEAVNSLKDVVERNTTADTPFDIESARRGFSEDQGREVVKVDPESVFQKMYKERCDAWQKEWQNRNVTSDRHKFE